MPRLVFLGATPIGAARAPSLLSRLLKEPEYSTTAVSKSRLVAADRARNGEASSRPPLRSRAGVKSGIALTTFLAIFGGGLYWDSWQRWNAPLPDNVADQRCAIWVIGSSSIYRWTTLGHDLQPWNAHNRGIGGALIPTLTHHFSRESSGAKPLAIVFYAGENDIDAGATADQALGAFRTWLSLKTRTYGAVPTYVVSLKASPARVRDQFAQSHFNAAVHALAARRSDVIYIDVAGQLLAGGRPGPFFVQDGIHLNAAGYRIWAGGIRDTLDRTLPSRAKPGCAQSSRRSQ